MFLTGIFADGYSFLRSAKLLIISIAKYNAVSLAWTSVGDLADSLMDEGRTAFSPINRSLPVPQPRCFVIARER